MHVVHRGHNRQPCFVDGYDYRHYLELLQKASADAKCQVHAYVLMPNHVHLLLTGATVDSISRTMKHVAEVYAMCFNRRYRKSGSVWEGRFHSSAVQSDAYLMSCYRYIEMNPVRAQLCGSPAAYPWSSYRANAFGAASFVQPHDVFVSLGPSPIRRQIYREMFQAPEEPEILKFIRDASHAGFALGDADFCLGLEKLTGRRAQLRARGRKAKPQSGLDGVEAESRKQFEMWSVPN